MPKPTPDGDFWRGLLVALAICLPGEVVIAVIIWKLTAFL